MRVATFNLHAGVDGWGRPTNALVHAGDLNADVLVCPEMWQGEDGTDFFAQLSAQLAMEGVFAPLARCDRVISNVGGPRWHPFLAHFTGQHALYYTEARALTSAQAKRRSSAGVIESGNWGLGFMTRLPIVSLRVEPLERLPREKVRRVLVVAQLLDHEQPFYVLALHGAHLSHGSYRQYRQINAIARTLDPELATILTGDFNCWRPLLRVLLPGWRSMVRARTWPAPRPHSQIDHVLVRGPWIRRGGGASNGGSDHLALWADLELP